MDILGHIVGLEPEELAANLRRDIDNLMWFADILDITGDVDTSGMRAELDACRHLIDVALEMNRDGAEKLFEHIVLILLMTAESADSQ